MNTFKLRKGSRGKKVQALETWLNELLIPSPKLKPDKTFDKDTALAVTKYQIQVGLPPTGAVDAQTWGAIGKDLGRRIQFRNKLWELPLWLATLASGGPLVDGPLNFRRAVFFQLYMEEYGGLDLSQFDGLSTLLTFIDKDPDISDVRWAAYMLATVKLECADTWKPIEEYGKGAGRDYGKPVTITGDDGQKYTNTYYGRGYVQLTWEGNYEKMGKALNLGKALAMHPEMALQPEVAYKIMSYGMRNGSFTGKSLSDYITGDKKDYKDARRIINGLNEWKLIQGYAEDLEIMLTVSLSAGPIWPFQFW